MTSDENRDQANLLLLCKFHSGVIDDFPEEYSPQTLKDWKQKSEAGPAPTALPTEDELDRVMQVLHQGDITIQAETVTLGGNLGGGGGSIGPGAFGGRGGDVTMFPELAPPARPSKGEATRDWPTEGEGGFVGFDGQPGGPTAVLRGEEVLLAVGGGGGGYAGTGIRSISDRLGVSTLFLANALEQSGGLWYILGGGWNSYSVVSFPYEVQFPVFLSVEAGGVPAGEYTLHLSAFDPRGQQIGRTTFAVAVTRSGELLRITCAVPLPVRLEEAGVHTVAVHSDAGELTSIDVAVTERQAASPGA